MKGDGAMKRSAQIGVALTVLVAATALVASSAAPQEPARPQVKADDLYGVHAYAWHLFVNAMTPTNRAGAPLRFENWDEQCDIQPALCGLQAVAAARTQGGRKARIAHGSFLASHLARRLGLAIGAHNPAVGCGGMNVQGFPGIPATNVAAGAVFCEEVFVNPAESTFVTTNKLITVPAQKAYGNVTFPWDALEIKVDWVPMSSFTKPFKCPDPNVYTETIQFEGQQSQCYALVSIHISSKVLPDWLWATFEPNYAITNPNRCKPNLYSLCYDPWGTTSKQPYGPNQTPKQSAALAQLMCPTPSTCVINPVFKNYFLTGVQTQFVNVQGKPIPLGNSFTEFNAFVSPGQASCITCHNYAYAGTPVSSLGGPLPGWPPTGYACNQPNPKASCLPPSGDNWSSEDFSWLLGIMPQN
jgi:hypothetical protein